VTSSFSQSAKPVFRQHSPFCLENHQAYESWRKKKLEDYPDAPESLVIPIKNPANLTADEKNQILEKCQKTNTVIYRCKEGIKDKKVIRQLGQQLGLVHLDENLCSEDDGISGLQVMEKGTRHEGYIPYTNKPINWHTDGYYNLSDQQIRAMILHCVSDSATGGENAILDHEIVYIIMRDHDPEMVKAFMQPDVMTIPGNIEKGIVIREAQTGPVFSVSDKSGCLHMRYTARTRSIEWKKDSITEKATAFLSDLLSSENKFIFKYRLQPGEGVICNNTLHNRASFEDDDKSGKKRLLYRARYFDRVQ